MIDPRSMPTISYAALVQVMAEEVERAVKLRDVQQSRSDSWMFWNGYHHALVDTQGWAQRVIAHTEDDR